MLSNSDLEQALELAEHIRAELQEREVEILSHALTIALAFFIADVFIVLPKADREVLIEQHANAVRRHARAQLFTALEQAWRKQ